MGTAHDTLSSAQSARAPEGTAKLLLRQTGALLKKNGLIRCAK